MDGPYSREQPAKGLGQGAERFVLLALMPPSQPFAS